MTRSQAVWPIRMAAAAFALSTAMVAEVSAQAALSGKILRDGGQPIVGAEIAIAALNRTTTSDSTGAFSLINVTPGRYLISVRKVGYKPFSTMTSILSADGPEYEYALTPALNTLATVNVKADANQWQFAKFEERRAMGMGRYLTAEHFMKNDGRPVADIVLAVPGVSIIRGRGNEAWYASRRGAETITLHRKLSAADTGRGADLRACYATVVLNGQVVFSGATGEPLFDLNSLNARDIRGVEVYTGVANVPQQWLTGHGGCGVIAIWLK